VELLFAFFLVGYFVLSGFDIGVGMLFPLLARATERAAGGEQGGDSRGGGEWGGDSRGGGEWGGDSRAGGERAGDERAGIGRVSSELAAEERAGIGRAGSELAAEEPAGNGRLAGGERARRLVLATIAPFFLANEVWLVGAVGLASGAYPGRETALFGRLAPAVLILVIGWMVRDTGLWLRGRLDSGRWRLCCDTAIVAGSWTVALCWGAAIGTLLGGAFTVVLPVLACCAFALHGTVVATLRLPVPPFALGRRAAQSMVPLTTLLMAGLAVLGISQLPGGATSGHSAQTLLIVATVAMLPLILAAQACVWWVFRARVEGPSYL
jgi:cytochrome bd ubiquinol oxidase subunit II